VSAEAGLLSAILADPADHVPRLVYADWLEEHDQAPRAEFIRGQIHLARVKEDSLSRRRLARRMSELLAEHEEEWLAMLPEKPRCSRFVRGFLDKIGIDGRLLEEHATALFSSAPLTRLGVMYMDVDMEEPDNIPIPASNALVTLDLSYNSIFSDFLSDLAARTFPRLTQLRSLLLMFNHLDDDCVPILCQHPFFQQLDLIRCGANPISAAGRARLLAHFGKRVSFACVRDEDHLYTMQGDYFVVGRGRDETQLLMRTTRAGMEVALFDYEGNLLDILRRDVLEWLNWQEDDQQRFKEAWLRELGFESAPIKFMRFRFKDGERLDDFNEQVISAFDDWHQPEADRGRGDAHDWVFGGHYQVG
jgi:uncharacterized protein (TIGR02996 family)